MKLNFLVFFLVLSLKAATALGLRRRGLEEALQPDLFFFGNGEDVTKHVLGECMGDCDRDYDCQYGLVCYQRSSSDLEVPGCNGMPEDSTDYCVQPATNQLVLMGNNGSPSTAFPLGQCEGDCDSDSDCEVRTYEQARQDTKLFCNSFFS